MFWRLVCCYTIIGDKMKFLKKWYKFLKEAKNQGPIFTNIHQSSWPEVKEYLRTMIDPQTYGFVVGRDPEKMNWYEADVSPVVVQRRPPYSVSQAKEYEARIKNGQVNLPPIVVEVKWSGDDMFGSWTFEIWDGEHRSWAARGNLDTIPVYFGTEDWVRLEDLNRGSVTL